MKINPYLYGVMVLILFLGVIFGFQAAGVWSTSGRNSSSGQRVEPSTADTQTIKGWMTLQQVSDAYHIPVTEILAAFDLPAGTSPATAIKDLESDTFSVSALRTWIAQYPQAAP